MKTDAGFEDFKQILKTKAAKIKKSPVYEWQDLALKVIRDLNIPDFKKNSVFKVCKENSKIFIERCMDDTKELCQSGDRWKYFFKLTDKHNTN